MQCTLVVEHWLGNGCWGKLLVDNSNLLAVHSFAPLELVVKETIHLGNHTVSCVIVTLTSA